MTTTEFPAWLAAHRAAGSIDGFAVRPTTASRIAELVATTEARPDEPVTDVPAGADGAPTVADVAACAVLADCPPSLFPVALRAVRLVVTSPRATLGVDDPWGSGQQGIPPTHPVTALSAGTTAQHGLWSGYGALSAPSPDGGPCIGRTVSLFLQRHIPAYRDNLPVFGHPGRATYSVASHPSLVLPLPRHPQFTGGAELACAAVSGPRALYLGGAAGEVARLASILANGLLTAIGPSPVTQRAALVVVNPTSTQDLNTARVADLRDPVAAAAEELQPDGGDHIAALDLLPVVAGGDSQTWTAVAVGPPDSRWVFS